jgi:chromosome segregation ATPase
MSQLSNKFTEHQVDQRSKQLDLRESALAEKEALINDEEVFKLADVLEKQIHFKERRIDELNVTMSVVTQELNDLEDSRRGELNMITADIKEAHKELGELAKKKKSQEQKLKDMQQLLAVVKSEIAEQEQYLRSQEAQVNQVMADWNADLTSMQKEADQIADSKVALSAQIVELEQRKIVASDKIDEVEQKLQDLEDVYADKIGNLKQELNLKQEAIQKAEERLTEITQSQNSAIQSLKTQEQSISLREEAIIRKEMDLSAREQKLTMRLNLL